MKALKTVAVALGITLAALIVIPLIVLAGLFVWLKVTEEQRGRSARARSRRRLIREIRDLDARRRRDGSDTIDARRDPAGVSVSGAAGRPVTPPPTGGSPRPASSSSWSCGRRTSSSSSPPLAVLPPVGFTFLRFVLASADAVRSCSAGARARSGCRGATCSRSAASAALGFGLYQILWTTGLTTVPAGDSALIIASTPVLVALLAVVARSDVLTPAKLVGVVVSFVGVAIVIASGPRADPRRLDRRRGDDPRSRRCCWSIYTAFGAPYLGRYSPLRATAWATLAGTVVLAPIALVQLARRGPTRCRPRRSARSSTRGCSPRASRTSSS